MLIWEYFRFGSSLSVLNTPDSLGSIWELNVDTAMCVVWRNKYKDWGGKVLCVMTRVDKGHATV